MIWGYPYFRKPPYDWDHHATDISDSSQSANLVFHGWTVFFCAPLRTNFLGSSSVWECEWYVVPLGAHRDNLGLLEGSNVPLFLWTYNCSFPSFSGILVRPSSFRQFIPTNHWCLLIFLANGSCAAHGFWPDDHGLFRAFPSPFEKGQSDYLDPIMIIYNSLSTHWITKYIYIYEYIYITPNIHTYIHTYITLHYITLHYITLHYITLHYFTLHYITLHYITLGYVTLHCIALHYIALHHITLPFIHTYIHTYIHAYMHTCIHALHTYIYIYNIYMNTYNIYIHI